ncbi:MAG TPA: hypothetical protein VK619_15565, partial [Pyrinomonadaceae bacterium]|nr:hypothetical protein [Pyrinomonadaceae bacterium]
MTDAQATRQLQPPARRFRKAIRREFSAHAAYGLACVRAARVLELISRAEGERKIYGLSARRFLKD